MTSYQAKVQNINSPIVVQVTFKKLNLTSRKTIYYTEGEFNFGHTVYLAKTKRINTSKPTVWGLDDNFYSNLLEDDIIQIFPDGRINVLWEKRLNPYDIVLFITNQCNANCIMCPQPPHKDDYSLYDTNLLLLEYLKDQPIKKIGITGGEPTVKRNDLVKLLQLSYKNYPTAKVDLLTNAKKLSDFSYSKELSMSNPNINFCISFPSDNLEDFNSIIGADVFTDVLIAVQNLAKLRQNIELRIVIIKQNSNRLVSISEFIFRNFPFVIHIAFMGMEVIGHAFDNINKINIRPDEYNGSLLNAVQFLSQRDMAVSIYNIPYCLVDRRCWRFLRNSISAWKQSYSKECNLCIKKNSCPGLFETTKIDNFILLPITE